MTLKHNSQIQNAQQLTKHNTNPVLALRQCQTRNKVEQLSRYTLLCDIIACLTLHVAQLLTSRATNLLDRNRLYSRQLSRTTKWSEKVAQLCCVSSVV